MARRVHSNEKPVVGISIIKPWILLHRVLRLPFRPVMLDRLHLCATRNMLEIAEIPGVVERITDPHVDILTARKYVRHLARLGLS